MADAAAVMASTLLEWCDRLAAQEVTPAAMAEAIGEIEGGAGTQQVTVRPSDEAWARSEIISGPDGEPSLVRLIPADPEALTVAALDAALGEPVTLPPKVHFMDPVSRIYQVDRGAPSHTTAVIAELPPEGGEYVNAVVLRRDIRL